MLRTTGSFWRYFERLPEHVQADGDDHIWVWIGSHDEYKRLIKEES